MKIKEIRELSSGDLEKRITDLQRELGTERGNAAGATKSAGKIRSLRRTIARMFCIKREKELNINQPKKPEAELKKQAPKAEKKAASAESGSSGEIQTKRGE